MTDENVPEGEKPHSTSLTLLERAKNNENEAWQQLVELYAPLVYARCRQEWNLSAADAENVGQEVFSAVARSLPDFRRQRTGSFRKWLRTIVNNKCRDFWRKNNPLKGQGGSSAQHQMAAIPHETVVPEDTDEQLSDRAMIMNQAMKAVRNEFSNRDWQIFWSISIDGRDRELVAEENNVNQNIVNLAVSRIRKRLRDIYEDLIDEDLL